MPFSSKLPQALRLSIRTALLATALLATSLLAMPSISYAESDQDVTEPEVVIKQDGNKKISEYYVHGQLVEIKIESKNAPTYYLIPSPSGQMLRSDESQMLLPTWKLLEW